MSDAPRRTGRPPQVTFGAGTVIAAAAIHVLSSFDAMSGLRTVDSKDRAQEIIKSAGSSGFDLTQAEVLDLMHTGVLISGAAAAAAVVMGIYALRGHRAAPPMLAVLSALVVLGSLLTDPLMGMVLAAGTVVLWSGPARDWFAGRPVRPSRVELALAESRRGGAAGPTPDSRRPSASAPPPPADPGVPTDPPPAAQPAPYQPTAAQQPPYRTPQQAGPPVYGLHQAGQRRPGKGSWSGPVPAVVRAAALITIVTSTMVAMLYVLCLLLLAFAREPILAELRRNPDVQRVDLAGADLVAVVAIASVFLLVWSLSALVLAVLTWRGHNWARILLIMSSVVMVLLCVVGLPVTLPLLLAGGAVVALLLMPQAREYFTGGRFIAPPSAPTGPAPWGSAQDQSPYGPPPSQGTQPPRDQLPPPSNPGGQPPAPPAPQDPTKDEDGKPPVW